jgi:hypothetical protein
MDQLIVGIKIDFCQGNGRAAVSVQMGYGNIDIGGAAFTQIDKLLDESGQGHLQGHHASADINGRPVEMIFER